MRRAPPPPACWRRWPSATRPRSTATTGTLFRVTGVAHLMSISGLHVTMFAWLAGAAGRAGCGGAAARLMLAVPAPHGGALGRAGRRRGLRAARRLGRAGAAHGVDDRRRRCCCAALGAALAAAAGAAGRRGWRSRWLDPWALLQPGFWLSFVAVALLVARSRRTRRRPRAAGGGAAGVCAGAARRPAHAGGGHGRAWRR
ncbi:MAG: ComEC/Rec2 family competence protein [Comamonadaceae bacterium]|nr:ComEC/Rec2 family competence protein [Comamonadaceae bacterium]